MFSPRLSFQPSPLFFGLIKITLFRIQPFFFVPSKNQSIFPRSEFNHDKAEKGQTYNYQMIMMEIFEVKQKYLNFKGISGFSSLCYFTGSK